MYHPFRQFVSTPPLQGSALVYVSSSLYNAVPHSSHTDRSRTSLYPFRARVTRRGLLNTSTRSGNVSRRVSFVTRLGYIRVHTRPRVLSSKRAEPLRGER